MLPRVATTTGTLQPSIALQAVVSVDAAANPQVSAAALANLRTEVLLRLIETMLKHMPRSAEPNPGRDLLETLLVALKTLPASENGGRSKLADIMAKLPPELRPSVEKMIGTVLSSMPTRSLIEIVRNPNGPEAQKLSALLSASLVAEELPTASTERQQKPLALTTQQLAAVNRQNTQQIAAQILGDARALQTALKRIFDTDGNSRQQPPADKPTETEGMDAATQRRQPADTSIAARPEARATATLARAADHRSVEATETAVRHNGSAEELQGDPVAEKRKDPTVRNQATSAASQTLARNALQAMTRDVSPAHLMEAVTQLIANLSPEEANVLRALLERPLDAMLEHGSVPAEGELAEEAVRTESKESGKAQSQPSSSNAGQPVEADDMSTIPRQQHEPSQTAAVANALPDRIAQAAVLREGIPLAFVPYLTAQEELETPEHLEREQEEEANEDQAAGEEGTQEGLDEKTGDGDPSEEPETPDMARRRAKTAEMVGVLEPGLVFYQKLGDYWT